MATEEGETIDWLRLPSFEEVTRLELARIRETNLLLLNAMVPETDGLELLGAEKAYPLESIVVEDFMVNAIALRASGDTERAMELYGNGLCVLANRDIQACGIGGRAYDLALGTGRFLVHQYNLLRPALAAVSQVDIASTEAGLQGWLENMRKLDFGQEDIIALVRAVRASEGFNPQAFSGNDLFRESGRLVGLAAEVIKRDPGLVRSEFKGGSVNKDDFVRALGVFAQRAAKMEPVLAKAEEIGREHPAAFGFDLKETISLLQRSHLDMTLPPPGLTAKLRDLGVLKPVIV